MESKIKELLKSIQHPESGEDIVSAKIVDNISVEDSKIRVTLIFKKSRDPFSIKIKSRVQELLSESFSDMQVTVYIREGESKRVEPEKPRTLTTAIAHTLAIASGKGGVGKSTVTANLAITLRDMGF